MEVKLFVHNTLDAVEKEINEWLTKHPIKIHHITQSQSEKQGRFVFVISIFYENSLSHGNVVSNKQQFASALRS